MRQDDPYHAGSNLSSEVAHSRQHLQKIIVHGRHSTIRRRRIDPEQAVHAATRM